MNVKKRLNWLVVTVLALGLGALLVGPATAPAANAANDSQFFPQTNHTVSGQFLTYWRNNGGLAVFGYPITDATNEVDSENGNTYLTQWFERNSFQYHPENKDPYKVELGLLGKRLTDNRIKNDPAFQPTIAKQGYTFFKETNHNVDNRFFNFWQQNGGLTRFGYPIAEPAQETDPATGKVFLAQWFERARFEYHPENPDPYKIELGLAGNEVQYSAPDKLIQTYYAAINNKTFEQAYNYWDSPTDQLPAYNDWVNGYKNTKSVSVVTGNYQIGAAAGNRYSSVPVVINSTQTDGSHQVFYGCYQTHKVAIENDTIWHISQATIKADTSGSSTQTLLASATSSCGQI